MVMEGDLVGLNENKLGISEILDQIHEKASSVVEFSLQWEEMDEQLKERAMEVELKEKSVMEHMVELEKKEERLKEVEERERKIGLLEKSITLRLEEEEKENDVKQFLESSVMRLVLEKKEEEVMEKLEEREKKVELLSKLIDEKTCELDRRVKDFDLKQKVSIERRGKEAEVVKLSLKQLEAKEKELRLLDEAAKEKLAELEKKKEIFEAKQKEKAEDIEEKNKFLELKEKKLEEMVKELESKQREFQERSIQGETCKRSRVKMFAEKCSEADSLLPPAKKHKSHSHDDEDKGKDPACVVSASVSSSEHINEAHEGEIDEVVSIGDTYEDPEQLSCGRNFIAVNPREGETWALFRDWSKSWNNNPEQHKLPYRYDLVEVISFEDHLGFGVTYLGKVEGFVSVFKHAMQHGVISLLISLEEMHRFSHRVPSVRLNGEEKEGVPAGSFELDPAAVPSSILKLDHSIREEAEETERQGEECGKAGEVEDQDGSRKDIPIIMLD